MTKGIPTHFTMGVLQSAVKARHKDVIGQTLNTDKWPHHFKGVSISLF